MIHYFKTDVAVKAQKTAAEAPDFCNKKKKTNAIQLIRDKITPKELNKKTCIFLRSEIVYKDMRN